MRLLRLFAAKFLLAAGGLGVLAVGCAAPRLGADGKPMSVKYVPEAEKAKQAAHQQLVAPKVTRSLTEPQVRPASHLLQSNADHAAAEAAGIRDWRGNSHAAAIPRFPGCCN